MRRLVPWAICAVLAGWVVAGVLRPPDVRQGFDTAAFGRLPVVMNGRVQPLDSVGRNALLQIRGTTTVSIEGDHREELGPADWLLEVLTRPDSADRRDIFLIHHQEILGELELERPTGSGLGYYSYQELEPKLAEIERQAQRVETIEAGKRSAADRQIVKLYGALLLYRRLQDSLQPNSLLARGRDGSRASFAFSARLARAAEMLPAAATAFSAMREGDEFDRAAMAPVLSFLQPFQLVAKVALPLLIPPPDPATDRQAWTNVGDSLLGSLETRRVHPAVIHWAAIAAASEAGEAVDFNSAVKGYRSWLSANGLGRELRKALHEQMFHQARPFLKAIAIYLLAFILCCASWLRGSTVLYRSAVVLACLGLAVHTAGLLTRMVLEGRPPVTNLYSSAVFVGWGAVVLGLVMERFWRNGIGLATATFVGLVTQIIAHNLALGGDTMQMMQAVLDNNFWLATHVVVITLGYSTMLLAGFMATAYIVVGVATPWLSSSAARSLERMVYGVLCFATLFSFVGTMLGGIWADQSWGRFWGWDPKENGALMIVLWAAIFLHVRWGGLLRKERQMALAAGGTIVTGFSWFGVNMLGVGLHSYGFMDSAFRWLIAFVAVELAVVGFGLLPRRLWWSFQRPTPAPVVPPVTAPTRSARRPGGTKPREAPEPALARAGATSGQRK